MFVSGVELIDSICGFYFLCLTFHEWICALDHASQFYLMLPWYRKMGQQVKGSVVPESVLKKRKREQEWALAKKQELEAKRKKN